MKGSNMRDKARATFGKTFFENTKEPAPAKNGAVALQKRANARPIPTYKVGGVVKKADGGRPVSTGSPTMRSTGSPTMQSTGSPTAMRSTGSPTVMRSTGSPTVMRSTGSPTVMRSTGSPVSTAMPVSTKSPTGATPPGMSSKLVKKKAVGGVAKKQNGGALTPAEKARAQAMIKQRGDAAMRDPLVMRYLDAQNRAPMSVPGVGPKAATKRAEGGGIESQRLKARVDAGNYKKGGKIAKKAVGGKAADRGKPVASTSNRGKPIATVPPTPVRGVMTRPEPTPVPVSTPRPEPVSAPRPEPVSAPRPEPRPEPTPPTRMVDESTYYANRPQTLTLSNVPGSPPRPIKKGGAVMKPVKRAVGGAGKTRKGQMKGC